MKILFAAGVAANALFTAFFAYVQHFEAAGITAACAIAGICILVLAVEL